MIKKYSQKSLDKRKLDRACLEEFFKRHIEIAKSKFCEECESKLKGNVSEIAHVIPKQYFKSVMCSDLNILYLCGLYSDNNCHSNYDNFPQEKVKEMNIFTKVQKIFKELQGLITEKLNYKHYERYDN